MVVILRCRVGNRYILYIQSLKRKPFLIGDKLGDCERIGQYRGMMVEGGALADRDANTVAI